MSPISQSMPQAKSWDSIAFTFIAFGVCKLAIFSWNFTAPARSL